MCKYNSNTKWTREQELQLLKLYKNGKTFKEIGKILKTCNQKKKENNIDKNNYDINNSDNSNNSDTYYIISSVVL